MFPVYLAQALFRGGLSLLLCCCTLGAEDADLEALLREGLTKYSQRDFNGAVAVWNRGLEVAKAQKDPLFEGSFHGNLGIAYIALNQPQPAETHLAESIRLARENGDRQGEKNRLNSLGGLQLMRGQFREALQSFERGLELAIALEDKLLQSDIHSNLGLAYAGLGLHGRAREHFKKAMDAGDDGRILRETQHLAALAFEEGEAEKARDIATSGLERARNQKDAHAERRLQQIFDRVSQVWDGKPESLERLRSAGRGRQIARLRQNGYLREAAELEATGAAP